MMKNFKGIRKIWLWLVPLLSILVIYETLILFKNPQKETNNKNSVYIPTPKTVEIAGSTMKLAFVPSGVSFQQGETVKVDLWLSPKKKTSLDGINLLIGFNPEFLQITQVETPKLFSSIIQDKESEEDAMPAGRQGKIHLIFLEEKNPGVFMEAPVKLLTLTVKGRAIGEGEMTVMPEGGETVITQTNVSKKVSFDYGNLKLVVY